MPALNQIITLCAINSAKIMTMNVEVITGSLKLDIYRFSGIAINKDYTATAFTLMDKMWQAVRTT